MTIDIIKKIVSLTLDKVVYDDNNAQDRQTIADEISRKILSELEISSEGYVDLSFIPDKHLVFEINDRDLFDECFVKLNVRKTSEFIKFILEEYADDQDIIEQVNYRDLDSVFQIYIEDFETKELINELKRRSFDLISKETAYYLLDMVRKEPRSIQKMDAEETLEFFINPNNKYA